MCFEVTFLLVWTKHRAQTTQGRKGLLVLMILECPSPSEVPFCCGESMLELMVVETCGSCCSHCGAETSPTKGYASNFQRPARPQWPTFIHRPHLLKMPQLPKAPPQTGNQVFKCEPEGAGPPYSNHIHVVCVHSTSAKQKEKLSI